LEAIHEASGKLDATMFCTVWIPTLKSNAPSNASGMAHSGWCYKTRRGALSHPHYNNHARYASARKVIVDDTCAVRGDVERILQRIADTAATVGEFEPKYLEAERLLLERRYAEAILLVAER